MLICTLRSGRSLAPALTAASALFVSLVLVPANAETGGERAQRAEARWSQEGLRRAKIPGIDLAYVLDGARIGSYDAVWFKSVEVAFHRNWRAPFPAGSRIAVADLTRVRDDLARAFRESASREFAGGGVRLSDGPGERVLEVEVSIVDLYLNALDVGGPLPVQRYTMSFGEMTLVAELRDSLSGALLACVLDRRVGRDRGQFELTTSAETAAEMRAAARSWTRMLREHLKAAHAAPVVP